jgi:ubiquinone/menaquinone biosynthesis C-methylase UbiE
MSDDISKTYDSMAPGYDKGSEGAGWRGPEAIVSALGNAITPRQSVLDIGAGTGLLSKAFRKTTAGASLHITAMDFSAGMLNECRKAGHANYFVEQDITMPWNIANNSRHIVALSGVTEHLNDAALGKVIKESRRTLKPGGKLAFTFLPAAEDAPPSKPGEQQKHKVSDIEKMCQENGIRLESVREFPAYQGTTGTVTHAVAVGVRAG